MPGPRVFRTGVLPVAAALMLALAGCDQGASMVLPGAGLSSSGSAAASAGAAVDSVRSAASAAREAAPQRGPELAGDRTSAGPEVPAVPEIARDALKVAFVSVSAIDRSARTQAHEAGRKALVEAHDGRVYATLMENVPEAEAERVFRELVAQGHALIFAANVAYRDVVQRLASEFPKVRWEVLGQPPKPGTNGAQPGNLRFYDVRAYEGAYLAGVVAGRMTRTDTLGFIASVPVPEVIRNIDAYALGAQSVNPAVRVKVAWVNAWLDPVRETEAAQSLIDSGADVLLPVTGSTNPMKVAERAGKHVFGWATDMSMASSKAHLGSVVFNWGTHYQQSTQQLLDRRWKALPSWQGVKDGALDLIALSDRLPPDVRAQVDERRKALAAGKLQIWRGPIVSSDDRELVARDKVADDRFLAGLMTYVKGVEGQVPAGR
ncbi:MAG: BMP family ABC transporter substrate-binding protein [Lautropia sp.]|nr:BMP family ABC transporter substrate-binding protein [Lautropia sp.]